MNLLQLLLGSMTSQNTVNSVSKKTGASSSLVSKLMILAIPMLIKYLTKNASNKQGQQSLLSALTQHKNTDTMENQIAKADEVDGAKIINHIFGNDKKDVVNNLAQETGLSANQVSQVLSTIAPSLMSGLSAATNSANSNKTSDLSGLLSMFAGNSKPQQSGLGLESFLGALGGNSKPQASANPLGALTSLMGAGNQSQASGLTSMLGGLLGGQDEKQAASSLDGSQLLSLLANLK